MITREELSPSLIKYLNTLGLTEEQVDETIKAIIGDKE